MTYHFTSVGRPLLPVGGDTAVKIKDDDKSGAFEFMRGGTNTDAFDFVQKEIAAKLP